MTQTETFQPQTHVSPNMLLGYWDVARRRKWVLLGTVAAVFLGAVMYCVYAPKVYRSETLILIEDQKIPENYVQASLERNANFERRLFVIESQVRNRAWLEKVMAKVNPYPEQTKEFGVDWAIAKVAGSIEVTQAGKSSIPGQNMIGAFTISFFHEDPAMAVKVISRLTELLIEEDMMVRAQAAEGTTEFLVSEVASIKQQLDAKEEQISQYKSKHAVQLPQVAEANLRALDRIQTDLNTVGEDIKRKSDRLVLLDSATQQYIQSGVFIPTLVNSAIQPNPSLLRLNELKDKLAQLRAEFWDGYPEVMVTKEEITQLEMKIDRQYNSKRFGSDEQIRDPYYNDLGKQKQEVKSELALLVERQKKLLDEQNTIKSRVAAAPSVEQDLLFLVRDYENLKGSYQSLVEKRLHASMMEHIEKRQKGAQLRILENATLPRSPEKPNQPRVLVLGLLFGVAMGMGLAVMVEQMNPQFRRPEDLELIVGPQLLVSIPDFSLAFTDPMWKRLIPSLIFGTKNGSEVATQKVAVAESGAPKVVTESREQFDRSFVTHWLPGSFAAEQYRVAATRLTLLGSRNRSQVIPITSAIKGEGKTTTTINLGYTMARDLGKHTLLIDFDFQHPNLHTFIKFAPLRGIADCLMGHVRLDDCMVRFTGLPCWIMPVGSSAVSTTEILRTEKLVGILDQLRERFEYIFINAPPVLPQATMNILTRHADLLVFVIRADSTPKPVAMRGMSSLQTTVPIHVILNGAKQFSLPSYVMGDNVYMQAGHGQPDARL